MTQTLLINATPFETRVALLDGSTMVEFSQEAQLTTRTAGNIYKGEVMRVLPGLQAAFVDIGIERPGFLQNRDVLFDFDDLMAEGGGSAVDVRPRTPIQKRIREGQEILTQVARDPIGTKGAQLTSQLSFPGRYLVYLPTLNRLGISRRITQQRSRQRLRKILTKIMPEEGGFIVRTSAAGQEEKTLVQECEYLVGEWQRVQQDFRSADVPSILYKELPLAERTIRDLWGPKVGELIVDSPDSHKQLREFAEKYNPKLVDSITLWDGKERLFEKFGVEAALETALSQNVPLKSGGYLVIQQTEALTAIDVNTGRNVGRDNFEETIVKTNLEAVEEIAIQLRLRNIGGLIILDLIDMAYARDRKRVSALLEKMLEQDKSPTNIIKISEFGLLEMTRKRTTDSLNRSLTCECDFCEGTGMVLRPSTVGYRLLRTIYEEATQKKAHKKPGRTQRGGRAKKKKDVLVLHVHPDVAAFLEGAGRNAVADVSAYADADISTVSHYSFHPEESEVERSKA